jgi:hypothetical protein
MKKSGVLMGKRIIFLLILVATISIVGFSDIKSDSEKVKETNLIEEEEKLVIEKRSGTDSQYEQFKEITDKEKIEKVLNILQKADWKNAKVQMTHPPDYIINNKYKIWLTPPKNMLEVIFQNHYTKLSEKDFKELYEIITERKAR